MRLAGCVRVCAARAGGGRAASRASTPTPPALLLGGALPCNGALPTGSPPHPPGHRARLQRHAVKRRLPADVQVAGEDGHAPLAHVGRKLRRNLRAVIKFVIAQRLRSSKAEGLAVPGPTKQAGGGPRACAAVAPRVCTSVQQQPGCRAAHKGLDAQLGQELRRDLLPRAGVHHVPQRACSEKREGQMRGRNEGSVHAEARRLWPCGLRMPPCSHARRTRF